MVVWLKGSPSNLVSVLCCLSVSGILSYSMGMTSVGFISLHTTSGMEERQGRIWEGGSGSTRDFCPSVNGDGQHILVYK